MPDFTEILKIAIEKQDWQLLCGLYTNITGEDISLPNQDEDIEEEEEGEEEDILNKDFNIEELKKEKDVDTSTQSRYNDFTAPPRNTDNTDFSGRRMRSEPVGSKKLKNTVGVSENKFTDDLTECLTDPETGEKLIGKNKNIKVTPRNKRRNLGMNDTSIIEAKCSSCDKSFKISSAIAFGYSDTPSENSWECNDCSVRKGRRGRGR